MSAAMMMFEGPREEAVLATIREMIGGLDSLTMAGQRHMMGKVVTALRDHVTQKPRAPSERNRRALVDHLGQLTLESAGHWPDVRGFSQRVEDLVALLSSIV